MSVPGPAASDDRSPSKAYVLYLMALLLAVNIFNFIDRQIPFILAESIKADLGMTDSQLGLMGGLAFAIVYSTLAIPIAAVADRYGRRWVLAACLMLWSSLTALGGLAQSFTQLILTRLGVATGEAGSTPTAHAIIAAHFPPEQRGLPIAVFSLGTPIGTMIGLMLGGWINDVMGWREALILMGLPGMALAIIVVLTVREPKPAGVAGAAVTPPLLSSIRLLWSRPTFRQMSYGLAVYSMGANAAIVFTPAFLMRSHDLSSSGAGMSLGLIYGVAGIAGVMCGGLVSDHLGRRDPRWRLWAPGLGLALAMPFTLAAWFVPSATASVLLLAAPKFANLLYFGLLFVALQTIAPGELRATASALLLFFNSLIGVSVGPYVAGWLSDALHPAFGEHSLRYALCFVVLTQAWAAVHFWLASRTLARDAEANAHANAVQ